MLLPELQQLAAGLGINTTKMRKSDLVAAIQNRQAAVSSADGHATRAEALPPPRSPVAEPAVEIAAPAESAPPPAQEALPPANGARQERRAPREQPSPAGDQRGPSSPQSGTQPSAGPSAAPVSQQPAERDDETEGGRRRGRRYRDRRGRNRDRTGPPASGSSKDVEPTVSEDDVLVPVAGILDAIEDKNTWFVRTAGYFASPDDVYVANSYVRRFGLRRGDAVTGAIRQPRDGERREKYNPLVRLDTVNGRDPEEAEEPRRVHQAHAAVPAGAAASGDRAAHPHHAGHRPGHADRQGAARADRLPAEGRQDDGAAVDRERDRDEQPRSAT